MEIDYEKMILDKLTEFLDEFPEMSFGEALYSITRRLAIRDGGNVSFFLKLNGKDIYRSIEYSINEEKED